MTKQYLTTEHIHPSCFFLFRQFIREWNSTERAVGELVTRLASEYDAKITVILTYGCSIPPTLSSDIAELRGLSNKEAQNTRRYISWKKVLTENLEETIPGAPVVIIDNDPLNPEQPLPDGTNWIPTLLEVLSNTKESEWLVAVSLSHDPAVKHAIWAAVVGLASGAAVSGATIRLGDACIKQ
ncbi:hypothetical protein Pelo_5959 [Pelomyxa schiedti]|nr:hypothetical protein Pelo_5959 [Pelomyxa schiedti]